jgi:hypothetical protein
MKDQREIQNQQLPGVKKMEHIHRSCLVTLLKNYRQKIKRRASPVFSYFKIRKMKYIMKEPAAYRDTDGQCVDK